MTYTEWAATVERGVTITPEMAFAAGAASVKPEVALVEAYRCGEESRDAEIAELKDALGYDWDKYKASQMALRECMQMVVEQDAEIAELVKALEKIAKTKPSVVMNGSAKMDDPPDVKVNFNTTLIALAAIAKVRKP